MPSGAGGVRGVGTPFLPKHSTPAFHTLVLLQAPSALRDPQEKVGATFHAHGISKL